LRAQGGESGQRYGYDSSGRVSNFLNSQTSTGSDTDTTAAVAGGLAGIMYGLEGIPDEWLSKMKSMDMIDQELFSSLQ